MIMNRVATGLIVLVQLLSISRGDDAAPASPVVDRIDKAVAEYFKGQKLIEAKYRQSLAKEIERADKIEIFLLQFDGLTKWDPFDKKAAEDQLLFPIQPDDAEAKVLDHRTLTAAERGTLLPLLMATVVHDQGGAFCHFPVHGLRVFVGDTVIFESSFCYMCENFYVAYPDRARWVGQNSKEFEAMMKRLMPIPDAEIARFKRMTEGKIDD